MQAASEWTTVGARKRKANVEELTSCLDKLFIAPPPNALNAAPVGIPRSLANPTPDVKMSLEMVLLSDLPPLEVRLDGYVWRRYPADARTRQHIPSPRSDQWRAIAKLNDSTIGRERSR